MRRILGIFADHPDTQTENAIVCENIAKELTIFMDRVVYFGRGNISEGQRMTEGDVRDCYEIINCENGVWKADLVEQAIKKYKLNIVFADDIWSDANGLIQATKKSKVPFHFLTPIDSLPITPTMERVFDKCTKVYVPNSSAKQIKNGCYLHYGINYNIFKPLFNIESNKITFKMKANKFTFIWIGKDEERKDLGSVFLAFEKVYKETDSQMIIRTDWNIDKITKKTEYFKRRKIPIIIDRMDYPHHTLASAFNTSHVYLCTSKSSAWEMELTEAMACGLPVLCSDTNFMNEHVIDGKNGFLIPMESGSISVEKLAEKMIWCFKNLKDVISMGLFGAGDIREKYSWKKTGELLYDMMVVE